jgi:ComF family protein
VPTRSPCGSRSVGGARYGRRVSALDVLFPRGCAGCGRGAWPFCRGCTSRLIPLAPPWCDRCGRPWARAVSVCLDCPPPALASARAPFAYAGPARRAVHRLEFGGWRPVASALADAIVACDRMPAVDVVTWVPLARRRLAERGYDQARALAEGVARRCHVPARSLLKRRVATGPQASRSGAERRSAMHGAFVARRQPPARVLLVDDVLTTGATAAACAEALLAAGADEVHLVTAARAIGALRSAPGPAYPRGGPRPGLWLPGDTPR